MSTKDIKFIVNNIIQKAVGYDYVADYYGNIVIAKTGAYVGTIFVYALNGIKLEAMMRF